MVNADGECRMAAESIRDNEFRLAYTHPHIYDVPTASTISTLF